MATQLTLRYYNDSTGEFNERSKISINSLLLDQDTLVSLGILKYVWHDNRRLFPSPIGVEFVKAIDWEHSRPTSLVFELERRIAHEH
jgi:hypothetical protein